MRRRKRRAQRSSQALRTKLEAHFATFERKQQDPDPAAFIRDRVAHKQWSDLYFAVQLAMDEKTPLKGLDAFGLVAKPDGKYVVDLRAFPQWEPLDSRLHKLRNEEVVESYVPALKARGFRDEDVGALRTYLANNDPRHGGLRRRTAARRNVRQAPARAAQGRTEAEPAGGAGVSLSEVDAQGGGSSAAGRSASWMRSTSSGSARWCRFSTKGSNPR